MSFHCDFFLIPLFQASTASVARVNPFAGLCKTYDFFVRVLVTAVIHGMSFVSVILIHSFYATPHVIRRRVHCTTCERMQSALMNEPHQKKLKGIIDEEKV